jgi:hypothetical protein
MYDARPIPRLKLLFRRLIRVRSLYQNIQRSLLHVGEERQRDRIVFGELQKSNHLLQSLESELQRQFDQQYDESR